MCNLRLEIDFMGLIYRGGSWFEAKICGGRSSICCAAVGGISEVFIGLSALEELERLIGMAFSPDLGGV